MTPQAEEVLAVLIAKQAIKEQIYNYCRGLDRMDLELALACWHADGTADFSSGGSKDAGLAPIAIPIADHFARAWEYRLQFLCHSHQATNILIEVHSNHARSETASISVLQRRLEDGKIGQDVYWGRWLDRWSLREGRWAIDHREAVLDCHMPTIVDGAAFSDSQGIKSRRDKSDPSYTLFAFA
jgi:hypothetical protein